MKKSFVGLIVALASAAPAQAQYYDNSARPIQLNAHQAQLSIMENFNRRLNHLEGGYGSSSYYTPSYQQPSYHAPTYSAPAQYLPAGYSGYSAYGSSSYYSTPSSGTYYPRPQTFTCIPNY